MGEPGCEPMRLGWDEGTCTPRSLRKPKEGHPSVVVPQELGQGSTTDSSRAHLDDFVTSDDRDVAPGIAHGVAQALNPKWASGKTRSPGLSSRGASMPRLRGSATELTEAKAYS